MEQFLNILWVLAVAGIVFVTARRPPRAPSRFTAMIAFGCIALLLFPVISATDDLHPGSELSDDAAWRHDKRSLGIQLLAVLILVSLAPLFVRRIGPLSGLAANIVAARPGHLRLDLGRAPPAVS